MLFGFGDLDAAPRVLPEVATEASWLALALVAAFLAWAYTRADTLRRTLLSLEDPRTYAILRIGFGLMTLVNFVNLQPHWRMLWSDEGLFSAAYAQDQLGRAALRGFTPDEGFLDLRAVLEFLLHKPSLLYLWSGPDFVTGYMLAFFAVLLLFTAGVGSRVTGPIGWLMMTGVYERSALYWEGTDTVYRTFWLLLLFSRTDAAWSVDNWLRRRRLAARGRLGAGGEPVHRLVPAWPRYLMMGQLAVVYATTGWVKTGTVWAHGDALYYSLNLDHFYRFELLTQQVSAVLGVHVFRVMTWVTLAWERAFPLVLIGLMLKHRLEATTPASETGPIRTWVRRLALAGLGLLAWRFSILAMRHCPKEIGPAELASAERMLHGLWGAAVPIAVAAWIGLGRTPVRIPGPGGRPWILDQAWLRRWLLGRRVWLTLGACFHGFLALFMNIGMFPFIMLMTYAAFVRGDEWAAALRRGLARLGPRFPALLGLADGFAPAEDPEDVRVRGGVMPDAILLALGASGLAAVAVRVAGPTGSWAEQAPAAWAGLALALAVWARRRGPIPEAGAPAMAYSAIGRTIALGLTLWHATAVLGHLAPDCQVVGFRGRLRAWQGSWLATTCTTQSWRMFAPNPPRSNSFMKTVIVEPDGTRWDLRNNAFSYRPNPWIVNDRMRKMQRRMLDKGKWYLRHWGAFQCREWTLATGVEPVEIEIHKLTTKIPAPDVVHERGYYDPRRLPVTSTSVETIPCTGAGRLPAIMLERRGLPVPDERRIEAERELERRAGAAATRRRTWLGTTATTERAGEPEAGEGGDGE